MSLQDEFFTEFRRGDLRPDDKLYSYASQRFDAELEPIAWALRLLRDSADGLEISQLDQRQRAALQKLDASQLFVFAALRLAFEENRPEIVAGYLAAYDSPEHGLFLRAAELARQSTLKQLGLVGEIYGVRQIAPG